MVSRASFAFPRGHASRARAWRERGSQPSPPGAHIKRWLANGAKVGTLLWLGTFIVWIVHGSATTFPNLYHFDTEDTGPAYTQVQIQHRSRAPGPPYNVHTKCKA